VKGKGIAPVFVPRDLDLQEKFDVLIILKMSKGELIGLSPSHWRACLVRHFHVSRILETWK
jgi:hypothetical protein